MGRVKQTMELITSQKKREACFQTRMKSMKKKAYELSTLCGVKVGLIMKKDKDSAYDVQMWPKDDGSVLHHLITKYKNQDCLDRNKRTVNVTNFLMKSENNKYPTWDPSFDEWSEQQLRDLAASLEVKLQRAREKLHQRMAMAVDSCSCRGHGSMDKNVHPQQIMPMLIPMPMGIVDSSKGGLNMEMTSDNMKMQKRLDCHELLEGINCEMIEQEQEHDLILQLLQPQ